MKATGIVRKVDELGRIVLPIELRRTLGMEVKDAIDICVEDDTIILKKYQETCYVCGRTKGLKVFREKKICIECIEAVKTL